MACDCRVVFGDERFDLELGSGNETKERGVGSGDDMIEMGLSSGCSSLVVEVIIVLFAIDEVRVCGFLEAQGRGIVIVKLCF